MSAKGCLSFSQMSAKQGESGFDRGSCRGWSSENILATEWALAILCLLYTRFVAPHFRLFRGVDCATILAMILFAKGSVNNVTFWRFNSKEAVQGP